MNKLKWNPRENVFWELRVGYRLRVFGWRNTKPDPALVYMPLCFFLNNVLYSFSFPHLKQAMNHNTKLNDAHRGMDELLVSGSGVLQNLREQRVSLKGVQRKVLDIAKTLGLSNTVLRLIERRTYQDKFILYGGMIVCCVIMYLVWRYFT